MSRRRGNRPRHLIPVDSPPPDPPPPETPLVVDTDAPPLEPTLLRHRSFDEDTLSFAARFGIELRLEPFPCRGYATCCSCFRCQRRELWTRHLAGELHSLNVARGIPEPKATILAEDRAAAKAAEYAGRLLSAPTQLDPLRTRRRGRRQARRAA